MSAVAIYLEGGGDSANTKAALRQGMDAFLRAAKDQARKRGWHWKVVSCGGRQEARKRFLDATATDAATLALLLLDSEAPVTAAAAVHVWDPDAVPLGVVEDRVHLMVQLMETWLVADADALARYYGQGFLRNGLPKAVNLETVPKAEIAQKLSHATRNTKTKGLYQKIRHGAELLALINPDVVRQRCPHCARLLDYLGTVIT